MKRALFAFLIAFLLIVAIVPTHAADFSHADAQEIFDGIVASRGESDTQAWIDGTLAEGAGTNSEWYVLALSQGGEYDFSAYERALLAYLREHTVPSATTREKYALCLAAIGSDAPYIAQVLSNSIGEQGIMSLVFGLHLLNNGYVCESYTEHTLTEALLALQKADGGWGIVGAASDVDATAMVIQALAPQYRIKETVGETIDRAVVLLSELQEENGGFSAYGIENAESTAQVIIALSALGIDCETDARFVKNGNTLFDTLLRFRTENGAFSHALSGEENSFATAQAMCAARAYLRMRDGKASLYMLDFARPEALQGSVTETPNGAIPDEEDGSYQPLACIILSGVAVVACAVLFALKKRNYQYYLLVLLLLAVGIAFVLLTDFRSADDYYNGADTPKENAIGQVTLSIRADVLVGKADEAHLPQDGIILDATALAIAEGDTVYGILIEAARKYRIQVENNGSADMAYIVGIGYLYEQDYGDLSGWIYRVNGETPSVGCSDYTLRDGDVIEWIYSLEMGRDIP